MSNNKIKVNELASKSELFLTDLLAVSDSDGTLFKGDLQKFVNFFSTTSGIDFKGGLLAAESNTAADGWYIAKESADYTAKGTTITVSLTNTFVVLIITSEPDSFSKVDIPLSIVIDNNLVENSSNAVQGGVVYREFYNRFDSKTVFNSLNDSNLVEANDLTFVLSNGDFNITRNRSFPWLSVDNDSYEFTLHIESRYLVIGKNGTSSVLSVTIDNTTNSCRIFRFNNNDSLVSVVNNLPNNTFTYGSKINAYRKGSVITIYENNILKFTYDYSSSVEPEFSTPVFGNAFVANGNVLTNVKLGETQEIDVISDLDTRIENIENDSIVYPDTTELQGQNMADVGDSLLDQNGTQPLLISRFGIASNQSLSVSGKKIISGDPDSIVNQIQNITNNPKLILIGGGTNDFGFSSPLGDLNSTDTTNFCGGLKFILDYAITNYPNSKILKLGMPFGDWQTPNSFANGQVNSLGLSRYDYVEKEKQICRDRGVYYVSQLEDLEWNLTNITDVTSDRVHPNAQGSQERSDLFSVHINKLFSN